MALTRCWTVWASGEWRPPRPRSSRARSSLARASFLVRASWAAPVRVEDQTKTRRRTRVGPLVALGGAIAMVSSRTRQRPRSSGAVAEVPLGHVMHLRGGLEVLGGQGGGLD